MPTTPLSFTSRKEQKRHAKEQKQHEPEQGEPEQEEKTELDLIPEEIREQLPKLGVSIEALLYHLKEKSKEAGALALQKHIWYGKSKVVELEPKMDSLSHLLGNMLAMWPQDRYTWRQVLAHPLLVDSFESAPLSVIPKRLELPCLFNMHPLDTLISVTQSTRHRELVEAIVRSRQRKTLPLAVWLAALNLHTHFLCLEVAAARQCDNVKITNNTSNTNHASKTNPSRGNCMHDKNDKNDRNDRNDKGIAKITEIGKIKSINVDNDVVGDDDIVTLLAQPFAGDIEIVLTTLLQIATEILFSKYELDQPLSTSPISRSLTSQILQRCGSALIIQPLSLNKMNPLKKFSTPVRDDHFKMILDTYLSGAISIQLDMHLL